MSDKKHSGENVAGVTVQMRFVPLKTDDDEDAKMATISVRVDDTEKGTPDNIRELKLPMISKLELEGETFVLNKIKLINTIFHPKGWIKADSLTKRLEKYAMFMENRAKSDFMICQRKARVEFIEFYEFQAKDATQVTSLKTQQDEFLTWMKEAKTLKKLAYITSLTADQNDLDQAYEEALMDYENAIMFFCGQKLWKDHRNSFREHKKYYQNQIRKPFGMSVVDFNDRMREYGDTLRFLQPSSRKGSKRSADADWDALMGISEEDIRTATYDALPPDYKSHIDGQYEVDFRDMDEIDFLEAMLSQESIDQARRAQKEKDNERNSKRKESASKKPFTRKGGDTNSENQRRGRRPTNRTSAGGLNSQANRVKRFCQHCKDSNGKYWTHDTVDCFMKSRAERAHKETNQMESVQKELNEMRSLVKGLKRKLGSGSDTD